MGNCQTINAAALVLQHPGGKIDRYYSSISVSEIMSMYPGHYVCLIIPLTEEEEKNIPATVKRDEKKHKKGVRFTRVQLLRPTDSLVLGHAYRLITSQGSPFCSVSSVFSRRLFVLFSSVFFFKPCDWSLWWIIVILFNRSDEGLKGEEVREDEEAPRWGDDYGEEVVGEECSGRFITNGFTFQKKKN